MNMANPAATINGVVPVHTPAQREAGDGTEQQGAADASGRPAHDPAEPAHEERGPAGAIRLQPNPRAESGQLLRELATEHDHGAEILEGGREAQLADERGATLGLLHRNPPEDRQAEAQTDEGHHGIDQSERVEVQRPQGHVAERRGGAAGQLAGAVGHGRGRAARSPRSTPPNEAAGGRTARKAAPSISAPVVSPTSAPVASQATVLPGRRFSASSPPMPPTMIDTNAPKRTWRRAGPRRAVVRSTGARRMWRTSARSSASGPPFDSRPQAQSDGEGGQRTDPSRAVVEHLGDLAAG